MIFYKVKIDYSKVSDFCPGTVFTSPYFLIDKAPFACIYSHFKTTRKRIWDKTPDVSFNMIIDYKSVPNFSCVNPSRCCQTGSKRNKWL